MAGPSNLKLTDKDLLNRLIEMANDQDRISSIFAHYHWLVDLSDQHLKIAKKSEDFPTLGSFKDRKPLPILTYTAEQFSKAVDAVKKAEKGDQFNKENRQPNEVR